MKQLDNAILIRMDDFSSNQSGIPFSELRLNFYNYIQTITAKNNYDNIIIDFSHDTAFGRSQTLKNIKNNLSNIDFITISLRPDLNQIIQWQQKRAMGNRPYSELSEELKYYLTDDYIHYATKLYKSFQFPTAKEFKSYNFKSVTNIVIDSSKPYERLFW